MSRKARKGSVGDFDQTWNHRERQRGNWNCASPYPLCPFSPHLWRSSHHFLGNYYLVQNFTFIIKNCLLSSFCASAGNEGSAENGQKETSTCDICQFGAECDVDAEDVWWVQKAQNASSCILQNSSCIIFRIRIFKDLIDIVLSACPSIVVLCIVGLSGGFL